jgi:hypothetical protein
VVPNFKNKLLGLSRGPGSIPLPYFWVLRLERGPLSLVITIEEVLGRKCSGSGLEIRECGRRDPSRWPCGTHSAKVGTNFVDKRRSFCTEFQGTKVYIRFKGFRRMQLYLNRCLLFYSNYPLHVSVVQPSSLGNIYASEINMTCISFRLKTVVRLKHVADNMNKIVNNYWNIIALDGNSWTLSNTRKSMQTLKFKIKVYILWHVD